MDAECNLIGDIRSRGDSDYQAAFSDHPCLMSSSLVLMAGRRKEGRKEGRCAEDKLIRFCLLIYPLLHAPRTNEREGDRERDATFGRWQSRAFPFPTGLLCKESRVVDS